MELPIDIVIREPRIGNIEALREYAAHRLSFVLRNFEHGLRRVTVRCVDLNGPKRGVDSRCSMTVELVDGRRIFVDATTAWPFASVSLAARRAGEALRRRFDRGTSRRHVRSASTRRA
jgi:hypothetical protein